MTQTSRTHAVATLHDGQLALNRHPVLNSLPTTCTLVEDPLGFGLFLRTGAETPAARQVFTLGHIVALHRFTCCHRYDPWWTRPVAGRQAREIPVETQYLLVEHADGRCTVFLPLLDGPGRASLEGREDGTLCLVVETGDPDVTLTETVALFVATHENPYALMRQAAESVVAFMGTGRRRVEKPVPDFVDAFGWCTWDAFYHEVNHDKVRQGLESFAAGGVKPRLVILDDGWLSIAKAPTGEQRLTAFQADPVKFPGGLKATTAMAREFGVAHFMVWHAFHGYWGGVDGEAFPGCRVVAQERQFSPGIVRMAKDVNTIFGSLMGVVHPDDIHRFYQDFYRYLRRQGVDGTKVDGQSTVEGAARGLGGRVQLAQRYHEAMEGAGHTHFGGRLINCMSHSTDVIYSTLNSNLTRSSTDFWPNLPASHGQHLYINAQSSLWMGEFIHPDWDMFQSQHAMGAFHAAGRAVSGGPLYVSDKPDGHDFEVLRKVVCSDGTILRALEPGRPTRDCLFADPSRDDVLLKIFNLNPDAGVVGVFNCRYHETEAERVTLRGHVSPGDIEGLEGDRFAVFGHHSGGVWQGDRHLRVPVTLPELQFEVCTVVPVRDGVAPFGLLDMFNSAGAVSFKGMEAGGAYLVTLRDGGRFGAWCSKSPRQVTVGGRATSFAFNADTGLLQVMVAGTGRQDLRLTW